ncbi:MAG TPA: AbrB/MazE/SpoVT family DNA-binding domain-containing protein [Bauldia sp.]|nr:AbrB/MazE/SpoVT family DNA-binding domain-containing protein [Bauldia sp.]
MKRDISGARMAEELVSRPEGATMREIIAVTGGPQYNKLRQMEARGFAIDRVREGADTRYFAHPPGPRIHEATITGKGQITLPKEIREKAGLRIGQRVRVAIEDSGRIVLAPAEQSIQRLFGALGRPPRGGTVEDVRESVRASAADRFRRAGGRRR